MKTFKDLEFTPHIYGDGLMSRLLFDNGYGVSVVRFGGIEGYPISVASYTDNENEWELAVVESDGKGGSQLCYTTPITDDVIGHLTEDEVSGIMRRVQELPRKDTV